MIKEIIEIKKQEELTSVREQIQISTQLINKKIQEKAVEREKIIKKITKLKQGIFKKINAGRIKQLEKTLAEIDSEFSKLCFDNAMEENKINNIEEKYKRMSTIYELGIDFNQACALLKQNDKDIILTEEDKKIISYATQKAFAEHTATKNPNSKIDMSTMKEYILVHRTDHLPKGGILMTARAGANNSNCSLSVPKIGNVPYQMRRETVHFSVNGEVFRNDGGDWTNKKYTILIPYCDMKEDSLNTCNAVDSYTNGSVQLPESTIILCPSEEIEQIKKDNLNLRIIGYKGNPINFSNALVGLLGYKVQMVGHWNWKNEKDEQEYNEQVKKSNMNIKFQSHSGSIDNARENALTNLSILENTIDKIIDNNIILSDEEIITLIIKNDTVLSINGKADTLENSINLQKNILCELITFLEEKGIVISKESIKEIMTFVETNRETENYENFKRKFKTKYNDDLTKSKYFSSLIFPQIFTQTNQIIMNNQQIMDEYQSREAK